MNWISGKMAVAAGVLLAVAGLLSFSVLSPQVTMGGDTDLPADTEVTLTVDDADATVGDSVNLTIEVLDAAGNPVANASCTFSIVSQPGDDASVGSDPATTDAAGNVTTTLNVGSTEGTIDVQADCGGITANVSVVAGAAEPPASLPASGTGGPADGTSTGLLIAVLVAALAASLTGAGLVFGRQGNKAG